MYLEEKITSDDVIEVEAILRLCTKYPPVYSLFEYDKSVAKERRLVLKFLIEARLFFSFPF